MDAIKSFLMGTGKVIGLLLVMGVAGVVGREVARAGTDSITGRVDATSLEVLSRVASEINKTAPMMIDAETELTGALALEGIIVYNYRLINYLAAELDPQAVQDTLRPSVTNAVCSTPETRKELLNAGVTMRYRYYDKDRTMITSLDVTKSDCISRGL